MCVTFLALKNNCSSFRHKYKLIILNNRDEFFDRKTDSLKWVNGVLAGRDLEAIEHGTWFGVNKKGMVGILLSITEPVSILHHQETNTPPSRGCIVNNYLRGSLTLDDYFVDLRDTATQYNGFQFLGLQQNITGDYELKSLTNRLVSKIDVEIWPSGVYGFGNSPQTHPFQKVLYGKKLFAKLIDSFDFNTRSENEFFEELLKIGTDQTLCFPDDQLKTQKGNVPEHEYQSLCSLFVRYPPDLKIRYGTRSHSILLVDNNDNVTFLEHSMKDFPNVIEKACWETIYERFRIEI